MAGLYLTCVREIKVRWITEASWEKSYRGIKRALGNFKQATRSNTRTYL